MTQEEQRAAWADWQAAWATAGRALKHDQWWRRLDAHLQAFSREAVATVLHGRNTPNGDDPITIFTMHYLRSARFMCAPNTCTGWPSA